MAIIGFPYNSQNRDRAIKAEVYRRLLSKYFTTGVFPNPSTQCQVVAGGGMNVTVKKGSANINGLYIELGEDVTVAVNAPDTLDRYDRIVLRNDDNTTVRAPSVVVIKGTPSESPQPPALTRNETVYDICLATVLISQMDSKVEDYNIEDTRSNTDLCGIVSATIESIDTTTFYNQIQADLKAFKENEQADFQEWFDTIKGILGTDEAGNLLLMIQSNTSRISTNEKDVKMLKENVDSIGSKLNSEITRSTNKDDELSSRIDQLVSPSESEITLDAEVIDGRVGYDGKTYPNIGSAIRGQASKLYEEKIGIRGTKQVTGMNTQFFDTPLLFFGEYYHGYYVGGTQQDFGITKSDDYYSIIIDCESQTNYHLTITKDIGPEDGNYWVKIGTSSLSKSELLKQVENDRVLIDFVETNTEKHQREFSILTNDSAKTLVILISKYQQPFVELVRGELSLGYSDYNGSLTPLYNHFSNQSFDILNEYDANIIEKTGSFYHGTSNAPVENVPSGLESSVFVLFNYVDPRNNARRYQILQTNDNKIYYRAYNYIINTSTYEWTNWEYILKNDEISLLIEESLNSNKISIEKVNETRYLINFGKYYTYLNYSNNQSTNSYAWNLNGIYYKDGESVVKDGTDVIGPIKEVNQSDFMGGVHGDEKTTKIKISCDGVDWDKSTKTLCDEIKIVLVSELYRVSDKAHVYNRFVTLTFIKDKIKVENLCKCVVDDSVIDRATNGGLISITNDMLTSVAMNNHFSEGIPNKGISGSKNNVSATLFWNKGSITVNNIIGHEKDTYEGYFVVFTNETPNRTKVYLDTIKAGNTQIANGEEILGVFEYIFN